MTTPARVPAATATHLQCFGLCLSTASAGSEYPSALAVSYSTLHQIWQIYLHIHSQSVAACLQAHKFPVSLLLQSTAYTSTQAGGPATATAPVATQQGPPAHAAHSNHGGRAAAAAAGGGFGGANIDEDDDLLADLDLEDIEQQHRNTQVTLHSALIC